MSGLIVAFNAESFTIEFALYAVPGPGNDGAA